MYVLLVSLVRTGDGTQVSSRIHCPNANCVPLAVLLNKHMWPSGWAASAENRSFDSASYHHVESISTSRAAGSHLQPPPQCTRRTQELLPRLQILDPPYSKTPFRLHRVPLPEGPAVMENHILGFFRLSCMLHQIPGHQSLPGHYGYRCRRWGLDSDLFACCAHGDFDYQTGRTPSLLIPQILTRPPIHLHKLFLLYALVPYQLHPFVPSPSRP